MANHPRGPITRALSRMRLSRLSRPLRQAGAALALLALAWGQGATAADAPRPVKVMVLSMFKPEAQHWLEHWGNTEQIVIPGLGADNPVYCRQDGACLAILGMGHANAAASTMALTLSPRLDLRHTYFIIAGIAGINPDYGTLGTATWAAYAVDFGLQWELDAREIPRNWRGGYLGINTRDPNQKPPLDYRTEVFQLDAALQQAAYRLSREVVLRDDEQAARYRANYTQAVARAKPQVTRCDTVSSDTWFSGHRLSQRATQWTGLLTDGRGQYCTAQQEDNATLEALRRAGAEGLVDPARVALLRTGSDFDRPPPGLSNATNLLNFETQGGFAIATENLYRAGSPLVEAIVSDWTRWSQGVPAD